MPPPADPPAEPPFRAQARWQGGWCRTLGSPFTALVCELVADRLDPSSVLGRRLDGWPGNPFDDALALRLTAGLHGRVRAGKAPALAVLYPPAALPEADRLWDALAPELANAAILSWLDSAPQTNEVSRSAVLMPGFLTVAAETGLPLALLELGSSAGLNLVPDRYAYRLGTLAAGAAESCLTLEPQWEGPDPPATTIEVESRAGVDLNPLDVSDPEARTRMLAYVWPDQPQRLERMAAAMAIAAEVALGIEAGDAAAFVEGRAAPRAGVATTVFHSIAFQYFPAATQQRIRTHMQAAGARATRHAPLAWLRFELDNPAAGEAPTLRLQLWPDGGDRLLATAHPHGSSVTWLG